MSRPCVYLMEATLFFILTVNVEVDEKTPPDCAPDA